MDSRQRKILELANLEIDCKIGKDRHFTAANRKDNWRTIFGFVSVIGAALLASKPLQDIFITWELVKSYQTIVISSISLLVALVTAALGFLGYEKQAAQHKIVGNMYIATARKARNLINRAAGMSESALDQEINALLLEYLNVNREAESCPTSKHDAEIAADSNKTGHAKIKAQIKNSDNEAMGITEKPPRRSLVQLAQESIKLKIALLLNKTFILSDKNYQAYIEQFK